MTAVISAEGDPVRLVIQATASDFQADEFKRENSIQISPFCVVAGDQWQHRPTFRVGFANGVAGDEHFIAFFRSNNGDTPIERPTDLLLRRIFRSSGIIERTMTTIGVSPTSAHIADDLYF
nr:hypothetical protein Iba_chr10aCG11960 [Ipomoea batatas]